jgi:putative CocE/NonD family hydrolase
LSLWTGFARRWLDLPAPRCRTSGSLEWLAVRDGTRLATALERPRAAEARATVIVRSAAPIAGERGLMRSAARLLAEQGYAVVVQTCRGLQPSEGRFQPFLDEARDGADLLAWTARQSWYRRPLVLAGFGYGGFAAWAAAGGDEPVDGLIAGFAASDPYRWLYANGALRLELALELAVALAVAEKAPDRPPDLARALRHRPLREADRVALRRTGWWSEWLDHPRRDAWWLERRARPEHVPGAALLIGACGDPALEATLADYAELCATRPEATDRVRLLLGPPAGRRRRRRDAALRRALADEVLAFLEALCDGRPRPAPVRGCVAGADQGRDAATWPPPGASWRELHLAGDGRVGADPAGELREEPAPDEQPGDRYVHDPADAATFGADPAAVARRGDVLRYLGAPVTSGFEIAGVPRVVLFAASEAACTDFFARLVAIAPDGASTPISHGLARDALRNGGLEPIEIALAPVWRRIAPGTSLSLELASSGFPHHTRHPNTRECPSRVGHQDGVATSQQVWHDARRPSRLCLPVVTPP